MRDAVKTAGEIDYRPSIAITRKGTSHSDQGYKGANLIRQVGAVAPRKGRKGGQINDMDSCFAEYLYVSNSLEGFVESNRASG